jgi:hypothetical protein
LSKETWQEAAEQFRNLPPSVKVAIERLTPAKLTADDIRDIEGDWIVAEVQLTKILPADRDQPLARAHEMIRKLLAHLAAK